MPELDPTAIKKTADMDGRYSPDDPYYTLATVHSVSMLEYVRLVTETS